MYGRCGRVALYRAGVLAAGAVLVLSGCTSTATDTAARTTSVDTTEHSAGTTPTTPHDGSVDPTVQDELSARLIRPEEFFGTASTEPKRFLTQQELAASDPRPGADERYASEGVVGAAAVHLDDELTSDSISTVLAFDDASGARADLTFATDIPAADRLVTFAVPEVPGAIGTETYIDGTLTGRNVYFVDGRYEYLIGFSPPSRNAETHTRAEIAAAADRWYDRVNQL